MQTVVIADDWPTLRQRLGEALGEAGYFTVAARTAQEALGLMRAVRADLLLAREGLSDLEGSTLAAILRRRGHDELVIVLLADEPDAGGPAVGRGLVDAVMPRTTDVEPVVRLVRRLLRPVIHHSPPSADSGPSCAATTAQAAESPSLAR